jgi:RNA polymerase sigma-70 factor, ECF subfamily
MEQYVDGDLSAYEKLYPLIHRPVRIGLRRWLKLDHHVEDALQVTMLKLHSNRHRYRRQAPVVPWVLTIARNVALDYLRSKVSKVNLLDPQSVAELRDSNLTSQDWNSSERKELIEAVRDAIEQLPDSYSEVLRLHKLEERTMNEVAECLGIKEGTARVRAHRGYKELSRVLKNWWKEDNE